MTTCEVIRERYGGRLWVGKHEHCDDKACALEAMSVALGVSKTDKPNVLRTFDLRPLNDIPDDPVLRAQLMGPLADAYIGSLDWPMERQRRVAEAIVRGAEERGIQPAALDDVSGDLRLDPENRLVPVDYGDVCVNYDLAYFADHQLAPPVTLDDLLKPDSAEPGQ